ncbi:TlpA disulfide reductase family protein [Chryseobacterium sp. HSC-36S06]|uniref:TlpA family protein disulfide reductase n=1 Tax=Chryseobacterium sp. HSC-36S06 TaxID=2910970 RepID=UPI0020A13A8A|nr:TlpA disulfide reductase family protein [Chryseobacterium sp. HSC-36S06]MCP2037630.1 thiol-disulfide isomerase/thioredoxin [Chryseobacterium sp. HSC-36S06]
MTFFKKNALYLIVVALVAVLFLFPSLQTKLKELFLPVAAIESAVTLQDSDYDVQLKGINVPSTNLKNLKGNKLVFLNFWGTWCAPCREEWPTIQDLYEARKDKIDFVLIAMQDKEEDVIKFIKEKGYTAPVYIAQSPVSKNILPKAFPTTFLLDKNGRILLKEDASKDWNSKSVNDFIDNVTQ